MPNPEAFRRATGRYPRRIPYGTMQVTPRVALPAQALYHFWNPDRDGVEPCPKAFDAKLKALHTDLAMCRPPARAPLKSHPWLCWYRKPEVTHWLSPGWTLLFCWQEPSLKPLPLDDRVLANLYTISAFRFGGAVGYFDNIVKTLKAERAASEAIDKDRTDSKRKEMMDFWKVKNIGQGNKSALHGDGSVVPSRGEANWSRELEKTTMPSEWLKERRERGLNRPRKSRR